MELPAARDSEPDTAGAGLVSVPAVGAADEVDAATDTGASDEAADEGLTVSDVVEQPVAAITQAAIK